MACYCGHDQETHINGVCRGVRCVCAGYQEASLNKYRCHCCSDVLQGEPRKICPNCHLEFTQIRNLVREMSRRMQFDYADVFFGLKTGINKLVDQINGLRKLLK